MVLRLIMVWKCDFFLNEEYEGRCIGRGSFTFASTITRFNALTPLDFYVWGTMKSKVCATKIDTREQLLQRVQQAAEEMRLNTVNLNRQIRMCLMCALKMEAHTLKTF